MNDAKALFSGLRAHQEAHPDFLELSAICKGLNVSPTALVDMVTGENIDSTSVLQTALMRALRFRLESEDLTAFDFAVLWLEGLIAGMHFAVYRLND